MRRVSLAVLLLLIAAVAGAATERRVHKTVAVNPAGTVSIDTHNGSVVITTWNQPSVDINARIESEPFGSSEDVDKTDIKVGGSGGDVTIESDYSNVPTRLTWFGASRDLPLVHYTISLPPGVRVSIKEHNASVNVTGLQNDLRVSGHNGNVEVANLGGAADIETHNGDIRVAFSRFDRSSSFETHNGGIDIRMPPAARFHVNASGHHMDVSSEFATVVTRSGEQYLGDVNGGGPELRVSTHNGSLRLRKS
ncbi:MAG TPA: DUF4097 family beta strand repeat-containing protein [Thermoanaerobaculia bacterium]|nr:DUF4097 family beta strand repeat-containing protein [Thermoanaerobaculia bacterium]